MPGCSFWYTKLFQNDPKTKKSSKLQRHPWKLMHFQHMQTHRQPWQTLIWSRTSFRTNVFIVHAATPAIVTHIYLFKVILQKWWVWRGCGHASNHRKHWIDRGRPSTMMRFGRMQPHRQSSQTVISSRTSFNSLETFKSKTARTRLSGTGPLYA